MQETPLPEIFDSRDEPAAAGALEIQPPAASTAVAKVDLLALAISRFGEWRASAAALVERYRAVAFDLSAATGYAELTKAIAEVRAPRYAAQNVARASKSELAIISKAVGAEEAAVTAFLDATEKRLVALRDAHDAKVAADKAEAARIEAARIEAERIEAARIEAERIAAHQAKIATIKSFLGRCQGMPAARIALGIEQLQGQVYGEDWQEFRVPAANAQCETLEAMRTMHAQTVEHEAEAARIEAERKAEAARLAAQQADQERVAAEQALAAKQLADQHAELASQREALAAQASALRAAEVALAEMARKAADVEAKRQADEAEKARKEAEAEAQRIAAEELWAREQDAARIAADQEAQRRHDAAEQVLLARIKPSQPEAPAVANQAEMAAAPATDKESLSVAEPATLSLGVLSCTRAKMIEFLPPCAPGRDVTIDGYLVPNIEVGEDPATGKWCLFLDQRYGTPPVDIEELHRWIPLIANALAIGAGYSCHGKNSVWRPNPYKIGVVGITAAQSNSEPDGGVPVMG